MYCREMQETKKHFSLRQLAIKMGYKTPSLLSDIINKKRTASLDFLERYKGIVKLSRLEEQFLENLIVLESTCLPEVKISRQKENDLIRQCWKEQSNLDIQATGYSNLDSIIMTVFSHAKNLSKKEITEKFDGMIPAAKVSERLDWLIKTELVLEDSAGLLRLSEKDGLGKMPENSFQELQDLLAKANSGPQGNRQQDLVSLSLTESGFKKAKEILRQAHYNIYMLGLEEYNNPSPGPKEVYCVYSSSFQATGNRRN